MGAARLLAKGWVAFCLFAGAHALVLRLDAHMIPEEAVSSVGVCVLLFGAMGLLFIAGYGATSRRSALAKLGPDVFVPGFNDIVFIVFAAIVFAVQVAAAHHSAPANALSALEQAMRFAVPGQRALEAALVNTGLDGGRAFASAASWILAFVFLGSAFSRIGMGAGLMRLERKRPTEVMTAAVFSFALSLLGIQFLAFGTLYPWLPKDFLASLAGTVLIGLGPLALAYAVVAAITNLLALNPEA
ncbi:MAG TPA: hypothetical protein VGF56_09635 [Rhizomicrobium sp.]|jgi:hypothetical protein